MKKKDVLIAARKLIERPENWCQGTFYRNNGAVEARCASGALSTALGIYSAGDTPAYKALVRAMRQLDKEAQDVSHFNDDHTHAEVLAAFDRAIAVA